MNKTLDTKLLNAYQAGDLTLAIKLCHKILKKNPADLNALYIKANLALKKNDLKQAIELFKKAYSLNLSNHKIGIQLANVLYQAAQYENAISYYKSLVTTPLEQQARLGLAETYLAVNNLQDAETELLSVSKIAAENLRLRNLLSTLYEKNGNVDEAISNYKIWHELEPQNPHVPAWLAELYLRISKPKEALVSSEKSLAVVPGYTRGFALKYLAHSELGHEDDARILCDNHNMIRSAMVEMPNDKMSVEEFNHQFTQYLLSERKKDEKKGQNSLDDYSTINGWHSEFGGLFKTRKDLRDIALGFITQAIDSYIKELKVDTNHPILAYQPSDYTILTWAIVNDNGGHQKAHIHPKSWLGGVYYVHLPDDFDDGEDDHAGWIEFGRGEDGMQPLHKPETRMIKPQTGMIVTFPGYFWHQTMPLKSTGKRICFAYDVQPTKGWGK